MKAKCKQTFSLETALAVVVVCSATDSQSSDLSISESEIRDAWHNASDLCIHGVTKQVALVEKKLFNGNESGKVQFSNSVLYCYVRVEHLYKFNLN